MESQLKSVIEALESIPVRKVVVNGTCEKDWTAVVNLARDYDWVLPCIGLHPWKIKDRSPDWQRVFQELLDTGRYAVGEIGLDRWIHDHDVPAQEAAFRWQLQEAARRDLPVTIHCLQAWGPLDEVLRSETLPKSGFLLHSYGGPVEMVKGFYELGGYFSLSGNFAHERKERQREVFRRVPMDRILLETDAPDMLPPPSHQLHFLSDSQGVELNHPANIPAIYEFAAELYGVGMEELAITVEANFKRFFANVLQPKVGING